MKGFRIDYSTVHRKEIEVAEQKVWIENVTSREM